MKQPELTPESAQGGGTDRFAEARALHPESKLVLFVDPTRDVSFIMHVPPSSPWNELLPPEQTSVIRRK